MQKFGGKGGVKIGEFKNKGSLWQGSIPAKPRFHSVPDVAVLNSLFRFLRNCLLSADVFQGASYGILLCLRSFMACSNVWKSEFVIIDRRKE